MRASPHSADNRRSGAVILDIRDLHLYPGGLPPVPHRPTARFADPEGDAERLPSIRQDVEDAIIFGECERIAVSYSLPTATRAAVFFSLGAGTPENEATWSGSYPIPARTSTSARLRPQFTLSKSSSKQSLEKSELTTIAVTIDIPAICVRIGKPILDGLQLWADDLSQMIEKCMDASSAENDKDKSRDPSLIGSRFFVKTRRSQDSGADSSSVVSAQRTTTNTETIVKVYIADGTYSLIALDFVKTGIHTLVSAVYARLDVPREQTNDPNGRPFDVVASTIDVLLEISPEGKVCGAHSVIKQMLKC